MGAGGAQRVASILCNHWAEQGHEVTLVTLEPQNTDAFYELHKNITQEHLDIQGQSRNIIEALKANVKRVQMLRKIYKTKRIGRVVSFMPENNINAALAAIGLNQKPTVIVSERSDPFFIPNQKIWRILRRLTYPLASVIVCQTEKAAQFFNYHKQVEVIANPVTLPPDHYKADDNQITGPFIAALGRLGHEKGYDILLEAFARIRTNFEEYKLVIIGEGQERKALEKRAMNLGIQHHVLFLGQKSQPFSILHKSGLFVMPSRFEGFPNALCEAMAHGLPVIASENAAGAASIFKHQDNCIIVPTDDIDALATAMENSLGNDALSQKLGNNAHKVIDDLAPSKICNLWDRLL